MRLKVMREERMNKVDLSELRISSKMHETRLSEL